ncbi:DTD1 [Sanghuangporus weigelae]
MRAVIQRVASASVTVDNDVISKISRGLMVLVGIGVDDTEADMQQTANKIISLHVFNDTDNPSVMWKKTVKDINGEILCVSQFTLMANTTKGNKPDFHRAMGGDQSRQLYGSLLERLGTLYSPDKIKDGKFGAMMEVSLTNEGPVTFTIDSRKFEYANRGDQTSNGSLVERSLSSNDKHTQ